MELKTRLTTQRVTMSFLLLLVLLTFSKCKKDSSVTTTDTNLTTAQDAALSVVSGQASSPVKLSLSNAKSDGGYSYKAYDITGTGDAEGATNASTLKLYEDGKEIGPGHSVHADIRSAGKGRFSHWGTSLYFSASDNTDPRTNGRVYTYTTGTATGGGTITLPIPPVANGIIGFAMQGGQTTGGQGGKTVEVSTLAALKSAVASNESLIIRVSGTITGTGYMNVKSNKTILGVKGSKLQGVGLLIYGTNNVIIRNMTITNVVTYSNIVIKEDAHHVWVDHCDLSSDRNHGWDYYDGLLDVGRRADYVSLSYNRLHDNNVAMLIGFGDENTDDIGHLRVTVYDNYFYNVSERQPCTRFGTMHVFNNYMQNGSGYGIGVTMGSTVRTDNNYFENQKWPIYTEFNSKPGYVSGESTNVYKNCGANKISTAASSWVPSYEYKSVLIPAANVPAVVTANAGAILTL